ncbi:MAG: tetratricopeptide repeat protein [Chlorobi bacterium]|nr:MAG: Two-component system-sensor histidine kinase [Chlorobi bacterium OLB7]MBK8910914.1 tetratricopeptide repeat protein [Chlorobiota bacterium]MBX7218078.1 tetratricopeptide repeat protein [Candidatus Kapabacteria bacterium]
MDKTLAELQSRLETAQSPQEQVGIRNQIAQAAKRKAPQQMLEFCEQTRLIARRHNYTRGEADTLLLIAMMLARLTRLQEALAAILESQSLYAGLGEMLGQASTCQIMGNIYGEMGRYHQAISALEQGLECCDRCARQTEHVAETRALIAAEIAWVSLMMKEYAKAIEFAEQAKELYHNVAAHTDEHRMMTIIGTAYQEMGRVAEAFEWFRRGEAFAERHNDAECTAISVANMGYLMQLMGNYDEALALLIKAHTLLHQVGVVNNEIATLDMIATLYSIIGNHESALQHYHNALQLSRTTGSLYHQAALLNNVGELYITLQRHDEAMDVLNQGLSIAQKQGYGVICAGLRRNIGAIRKQQGDMAEALRWSREALQEIRGYHVWKEEVNALYAVGSLLIEAGEFAEAIATLQQALTLIESANSISHELRAKLHKAISDAHKQQGEFDLAYHHYVSYHQAQSGMAAAEHDRNRQMLMMQFDLRQTRNDAEVYRLRSEQLERLMQHRRAELSALALQLVQKSEFLHSFREQIRSIILADDAALRERVVELSQLLDSQNSTSDEWELFEKQMNESQGSFMQAVTAQCPRLTPTELRVCFLIRIGLSTKEIASLCNVTERDIESHRRNIRRKLELPAHKTLIEYLDDIAIRTVKTILRSEDPTVTARLKERFPALSGKELKICVLLRSGYSTKEIAGILSTSERTVENHRYHIRQKLGLSPEINLGTFFAGI